MPPPASKAPSCSCVLRDSQAPRTAQRTVHQKQSSLNTTPPTGFLRALLFLLSLWMQLAFALPTNAATIVLDAGHGGHDPGGIPGQRFIEKHASLTIAKLVQAKLKSAGHQVIMTRSSDNFVELSQRVAISNRASSKAVFVSIHFNSATNPDAHGIETYFYDSRGLRLAQAIHERVVRTTGEEDRHLRRARFYVLRNNRRPAVLAELGFLTNMEEGGRVARSSEYRQKLANAVADGIQSVLR